MNRRIIVVFVWGVTCYRPFLPARPWMHDATEGEGIFPFGKPDDEASIMSSGKAQCEVRRAAIGRL
jgi:hypothetical protein